MSATLRLGTNDFTREDLAKFMSHYGDVASVAYTKNIGTLLSTEQDLSRARLRLHELRAWRKGGAAGGGGFLQGLFRLAYLGGADPYSDAHVARAEAAVDAHGAAIEQLSKQPVRNAGEAFVTFNYEAHCNNCFNDHRRTMFERMDDVVKCLPGPPTFNGKRITVEPPPEAGDVNWENFDVRGMERVTREAVTVLVMTVALGVGILLQVVFENMRQDIRGGAVQVERY